MVEAMRATTDPNRTRTVGVAEARHTKASHLVDEHKQVKVSQTADNESTTEHQHEERKPRSKPPWLQPTTPA